MGDFVHLHVHSPYSFLGGGSHLHHLVQEAKRLGFKALALTDWHSLAGAARFQELIREAGLKAIFGAEVLIGPRPETGFKLEQRESLGLFEQGRGLGTKLAKGQMAGYHLVLLAKNERGYQHLSHLISESHLAHERGKPRVEWESLERYHQGLIALSGCRRGEVPFWLLHGDYLQAKAAVLAYKGLFDEDFYLELQGDRLPGQKRLVVGMERLQKELGISLVATNNVHYAVKEDFPVFDTLTCIRQQMTLEDVYEERRLNGENYLKPMEGMWEIFREMPQALGQSVRIAETCNVCLGGFSYFPEYPLPTPEARTHFLEELVWQGARERYGVLRLSVRERLEHELKVIHQLQFADYFLVVWDALQFARRKGIRFAGRGSAADSAVAYCLKITEVDAIRRGLLFERFLSVERAEKPDIDVDFDSRYRDQVAAYFSERYGADKVAAVGTYQTFRARSAIREVGKAFGFQEAELDDLAKRMPWINADEIREAIPFFPELRVLSQEKQKRFQELFAFCARISEFPRFLGTHLGGIVVSREPIAQIVPLQWSGKGTPVVQADKRDIEELGLFKIDLLSLRTLSVVEDSIRDIRTSQSEFREEETVKDHPEVYARLQTGETMGIFQLESPAQRALQSRLEANRFEDVVASVALIRPGPVQGDMVEPYIARRKGLAPVEYLHPALAEILKKTYGVVLFQEQAIAIVQRVAGFTLGEADRLRRVMSHARSKEEMVEIGRIFEEQAVERGVQPEAAKKIFSYLVGYAGYGFCEAHAAAFATTALKTAYLIEHHPAEFFAALLNHQPMGFYPPNTLALEAKRRGVRLLPLDIEKSVWEFRVEEGNIRTGFKQLKSITEASACRIVEEREKHAFRSWQDLARRAGVASLILENLVLAGAFEVRYPNRKALLWEIHKGWDDGLFRDEGFVVAEHAVGLNDSSNYPDFTLLEKTEWEYRLLKLNTTHRLMALWRQMYHWQGEGLLTTASVRDMQDGTRVSLIGLILRPHRPPTRSGQVVVFFTLEDEFGFLDAVLFERDYQKYGEWLFGSRGGPRRVAGILQRRGQGFSLLADRVLPPDHDKENSAGAKP